MLRFGMDASYAPFESVNQQGQIVGFDYAICAVFLERFYRGSDIELYPTQGEPNLDIASGRLDHVVE